MNRYCRALVLLAVLAALVVLGGCQKGDDRNRVNSKDAAEVAKVLSDTIAGSATRPPGPVSLPASVVFTRDDVPHEGGYQQLTLGDLTDAQANQFLRRVKTEFCTCGCGHTIDQCLIQDPQCDVAPRLAAQVLKEVTGGK
jgi:hypothetical protein